MFIKQIRKDSLDYMEQFKKTITKLNRDWPEDKIYFTKSNFYFWASYKPQHPYDSINDVHIFWNKNKDEISVLVPEYKDWSLKEIYKKSMDDIYINHTLKNHLSNYDLLDELLYNKENKKNILLDILKNMNREDFEKIIIQEVNAVENDTSKMLDCLYDVIVNCKTESELNCVNNTIMAITGWNIESLIQFINEKDEKILLD